MIQNDSRKKIFVGMSGGVDSSVTAFLLKEQGHDVTGVFMKNWEQDDTDDYCSAREDIADAQLVCDQLNIQLHRVNFATEYWQNVFTYFLSEYRAGRTPNPDILCNKEIKFKAFLNYATTHQADFIATGHYARTNVKNQLLKGSDNNKDQSYFLHALNKEQLARSLFPVGDMDKSSVRKLANKLGFKNHNKKDSTGICFIGERKFKQFLNDYLPAKPGAIKTTDGEQIGEHDGLMFYTIGQRQGLKIGGLKDKAESPWYVVDKDIPNNILIVSQGQNHPRLYATRLQAKQINWIEPITHYPFKAKAKIRYRQNDQDCLVALQNHSDDSIYEITFTQPQRAVTPGQSIVFYDEDICLGGGIIL